MTNKIDSNVVGLNFAEESTDIGVLPGTPDWYPLDPNEFNDFGGDITTVAREPISSDRQKKKGVVTDLESAGGFVQDMTQTGLSRLLQGFLFADAHERPSTNPLNGTAADTVALQDISAGAVLDVDTGEGAKFQAGDILKTSNMGQSANNIDEAVIQSIVSDALTTDATYVAETIDSATAKLEVVGFEFADADASITVSGATVTFGATAADLTTLGLQVGEWIFIGGDATANQFANNGPGYARVRSISANEVTLDQCTWTPQTEAGAGGKTIRIYFGRYLRNEETAGLIKRRTFQLERTLGQDANGVQSEYITGAVANEFSLNFPSADKITADLSFMGTDHELRDGSTGVKSGTRHSLLLEDAYNSSNNVYQLHLYIHDASANTPAGLFAYIQEGSLTINNNASGLKAVGVLGSFDINVGDFQVGGELQCYFTEVAAISAVRNNSDVGFNMIASLDNQGFVFDIPLLSLGGGRANVNKDEPIIVPLEKMACKNSDGYTLSLSMFPHLPDAAMATT